MKWGVPMLCETPLSPSGVPEACALPQSAPHCPQGSPGSFVRLLLLRGRVVGAVLIGDTGEQQGGRGSSHARSGSRVKVQGAPRLQVKKLL